MKTRAKLLPRLIFAAILIGLPAAADAPRNPAQYGAFLAEDTSIKDLFTKLEWDRREVIVNKDWSTASGGCAFKFENTGRLPTIKELLTILDEQPHEEYEFGMIVPKMIDALAFDQTPVNLPYWSSTPGPTANTVWTLSFSTGEMQAKGKTEAANARCVR